MGLGLKTLTYGYGLKQMMERISILGGQLQFESRDGFFHARQFYRNIKEREIREW